MRRILATCLCAVITIDGATAFPAETVPINPPTLTQAAPADRSRIDTDATLARRLKAEPTSLNPLLMFTAVDAEFDYLLWDRPFVVTAELDWKLNDAVASEYNESTDHTQATLVLKPGLTWHDGERFTSADVEFSWRRIMDDRVVCRRARTGPDEIAACEALDPQTVRFTFKRPLPTNRWNVDFPIIPKHIYEPNLAEDPTLERSEANVQANRAPVGNGPYRLVAWSGGQRIVLERWEDYPGPRPAFRRMVFNIVPDNNAALLAFETGELEEMELSPQQFARETDSERFARVGVKGRADQWTTYYIGWNCNGSSPFLADANVRRALCHSIDIPRIIDHVFYGLFTPSYGLFHRDWWPAPEQVDLYKFNPAEAGRLLDQAGWRFDPADGWRYKDCPRPDGTSERVRAGFTIHLVQGSQTSPAVADLMQQDLKRLGVDMRSRVLEWSVFNQRNYDHEFDAYLSAWTPSRDPDEAWNLLHSDSRSGGRNYVGYANPQVDQLFEKARTAFSRDERRECYQRIARIVYEDAPYTFLVNAPTLWAFDKDLHGVAFSPRGPLNFYPGALAWWRSK